MSDYADLNASTSDTVGQEYSWYRQHEIMCYCIEPLVRLSILTLCQSILRAGKNVIVFIFALHVEG